MKISNEKQQVTIDRSDLIFKVKKNAIDRFHYKFENLIFEKKKVLHLFSYSDVCYSFIILFTLFWSVDRVQLFVLRWNDPRSVGRSKPRFRSSLQKSNNLILPRLGKYRRLIQ